MSPLAVTEALLAGSNEAVGLIGEHGQALYVGDGATSLIGRTPASIAHMRLEELVHPDDIEGVTQAFRMVLLQADARQSVIIRVHHAAGYFRTLQCHLLNALHIRGVRAVVVRITERRAGSEFPGSWYTRNQLHDAVQRCLERQRATGGGPGFSVLCLRIEHFARMEAGLGSDQANQVLQEVGRRVQTCVPPETVIASLGRGELGVLLEGVADTSAANGLADAMTEAARGPVQVGDQRVPASIIAGVATSERSYARPQDVIRDATAAAFRAGGGRRRAVFETRMRDEERRYLAVLSDLDRGIGQDELFVVYQPIVSLRSGQTAGLEALVRWQHPELGLIMPNEFIPLAEETGRIGEMGAWVLERACRDLAKINATRPRNPLFMSVNVSAVQLREPDLCERVISTLSRWAVPANHIKLEITETAVIAEDEIAMKTLTGLRRVGAQIALDDFGTGFASLTAVERLPIDVLKIDRSFVSRIGDDGTAFAIVQALVVLAANLKLAVVAEGVETIRQRTLLWSMQCELAQGYLFSKPAGLEQIEELLASSR
jgi:EAL domain-containing protein (putative c-di-GMP-specific phosphodiesterase class I)/GGDEF domain-containing protein